jgi:hypothetical protein
MEQLIDERVALALSKQSSHQEGPTDEMSPSAKGKEVSLQQNMHQQPQKHQQY